MKQCPQCNRTYSDEAVTFCLADGALLSAPYDSAAAETQRIPAARITNLPPTVVLSQTPAAQPLQHNGPSKTVYIIIGVMSGLIISLAGIILIPLFSGARVDKGETERARSAGDASSNESTKPQAQESSNVKPLDTSQPAQTAVASNANTTLPTAPTALTGRWQGQWSSPTGTIFTAEVSLDAAGAGGAVQGFINWTMKSTPQVEKQARIGLKAVEFVRGSYDSQTRTLTMAGYRKDDPNSIIILDKYRLNLSADNSSLGGATWNHGNWRGRLSLGR